MEQRAKERLHKDCIGGGSCENGEIPDGSSMNGDVQNKKQRPLSVTGGVDLFCPNAEEKDDCLTSVSLSGQSLNLTKTYRFFVAEG